MRYWSKGEGVGVRALSSKNMPLSLVLLFSVVARAGVECQSDPSEQFPLIHQTFVSQLGHFTPKLFLTFLLILGIGWNGSNKGYLEQGGTSPENSLPLTWVFLSVYDEAHLPNWWGLIKKKNENKRPQEGGSYHLSRLLLSTFFKPYYWDSSAEDLTEILHSIIQTHPLLSSVKMRELSGHCPLRIFLQRLIISNLGCCFQILREALICTSNYLVLPDSPVRALEPFGCNGGTGGCFVRRQSQS